MNVDDLPRWLPGRLGWRVLLVVGVVLGLGLAALELLGPARVLAQRLELRVVCSPEAIQGAKLRCRVLVRDYETLQPVNRALVSASLKPPKAPEQKLPLLLTDAAGVATIEAVAPALRELVLNVQASRGSDRAHTDLQLSLVQPLSAVVATDKPRYQPGQLIQIRAVAVAVSGRPAANAEAELAVLDPKGNQVLSERGRTSKYGIFSADFRLAETVLQGTYKVLLGGAAHAETAVEVEPYTLPKFHVEASEVVAAGEAQGKVTARHVFGEPVQGAQVKVYSPLGNDRVLVAETSTNRDGVASFAIAPDYVGKQLVASVNGEGIGVQEALVKAASQKRAAGGLAIRVVPQAAELVRRVKNHVYALVTDAQGKPASATLVRWPSGERYSTDSTGVADVVVVPAPNQSHVKLTLTTESDGPDWARYETLLPVAHHDLAFTLETDRVVYDPGARLMVTLQAPQPGPVYVDVWHRGVVVAGVTGHVSRGPASVTVPLPRELVGRVELSAYRVDASGGLLKRGLAVLVGVNDRLAVSLQFERPSYRPGELAKLSVDVKDADGKPAQAALGLLGLDVAVRHDLERPPGFELLALKNDANTLFALGAEQGGTQRVWATTTTSESARVSVSSSVDDRRSELYDDWQGSRRKALFGACALMAAAALFFLLCLARVRAAHSSPAVARTLTVAWLLACASLGAAIATSLHGRAQPVLWAWLAAAALGAVLLAWAAWRLRGRGELRGMRYVVFALLGLHLALQLVAYVGAGAPWFRNRPLLVELAAAAALFATALWARGRVGPLLAKTTLCLLALGAALFVSRSAIARFPAPVVVLAESLEEVEEEADHADNKEGGTGTRAKGESGSFNQPMGKRYAVAGPKDNPDPSPPSAAAATRVRKFFPETLVWRPELVTDAAGHAQVEVPLADSVTTWAVTASAISLSGGLGAAETSVRGFQDFFVDIDVPPVLSVGDELDVPVVVYNYRAEASSVTVGLEPSAGLSVAAGAEQVLQVGAGSSASVRVRVRATAMGPQQVRVRASAGDFSDALERPIEVYSGLYEVADVAAGRIESQGSPKLTIPEGALGAKLGLKLYRGPLSQVAEGLRGVFRKPHGCFEQTSSTTYPSVLALGFMRKSQVIAPELESEALGYIVEGYQRLLTFEVPGGGFSLWGNAPADVMLTAYGLQELSDLSRVSYADPNVITRTRDWLLGQAKEGRFDDTPDQIEHTAFVVRALAVAQTPAKALAHSLNLLERHEGSDPYQLALRALALWEAGRTAPAVALARKLPALAQGNFWTTKNTRTFYSYGRGRDQETTALCIEALTKTGLAGDLVDLATLWLADERREDGVWASTAATVAAMRAMLSSRAQGGSEKQTFSVRTNGHEGPSLQVDRGAIAPVSLDLSSWARAGENRLELASPQPDRVSYQLLARYDLPWSAAAASSASGAFPFRVTFEQTRVKVGDQLDCHIEVSWPPGEQLEMPMIEIGIAPGTQVVKRTLEELRAQGTVASFSVTRRHVVLYLPNGVTRTSLDLAFRAELPGRVHTPPSRAWGYYQPEVRALARPSALVIE